MLLSELERHAVERGWTAVRLDTNRTLTEAITMYRSAGYREIEPYNAERYADHWFEKSFTPLSPGRAPGESSRCHGSS